MEKKAKERRAKTSNPEPHPDGVALVCLQVCSTPSLCPESALEGGGVLTRNCPVPLPNKTILSRTGHPREPRCTAEQPRSLGRLHPKVRVRGRKAPQRSIMVCPHGGAQSSWPASVFPSQPGHAHLLWPSSREGCYSEHSLNVRLKCGYSQGPSQKAGPALSWSATWLPEHCHL